MLPGLVRGDAAVRYMSVPAGSRPPCRTDSHGQRPRNTLTSTDLKAGPSPGRNLRFEVIEPGAA